MRADLREWLRRASEDDSGFVPWRFELSFGLPSDRDADPASQAAPVTIDAGLCLRGSIDLVERAGDGRLRVTDHKTGKERFEPGAVVDGGRTLQPVLYALAVEKLFPGSPVDSGRLYYCTSAGGFAEREVELERAARAAARTVAETIGAALDGAVPARRARSRRVSLVRLPARVRALRGAARRAQVPARPRGPPRAAGAAMSAGQTIDAEARRQIAEHLDATLFVEAAAGTGKTTALVGRIVALLRSGRTSLDRVVALTFADKAAGEMRLRLRTELETARAGTAAGSDERRRLDAALEQLELARIATIHAFCGDLLQERPVEAGVDPLFAIAAPDEAARLLERAFDDWFQRALADPPEGVRRLLRRRARGPEARGARATLFDAARSLVEHRDYTALWRRDPVRSRARDRRGDGRARRARRARRPRRRPGRLAAAEPRERRALPQREPPARGRARARLRCARGGAARAREDAQDRMALHGPQPARLRAGPSARRGARAARRREAAPRSAARRLRCRPRGVSPARAACPW